MCLSLAGRFLGVGTLSFYLGTCRFSSALVTWQVIPKCYLNPWKTVWMRRIGHHFKAQATLCPEMPASLQAGLHDWECSAASSEARRAHKASTLRPKGRCRSSVWPQCGVQPSDSSSSGCNPGLTHSGARGPGQPSSLAESIQRATHLHQAQCGAHGGCFIDERRYYLGAGMTG